MADAETAVVQDAHLGGYPVCLIGIESRPVPRRGFPPTDGPDTYTAGTLFPRSSKKTARAINAASGNRPLVVLANLSGFDGSPESMRKLQLEYGAEIGRAIVNFDGPIVFCVVSRYHGGAFVVFSKALNPNMTVLARRGLVRLGDRRRPGRGRGVHRRGRQRGPRPTRGSRDWRRGSPTADRRRAGRAASPSWPRCGPRSARRSSARWRPSSTDPQHPARGRGRLGRRDHHGRRAASWHRNRVSHEGNRAVAADRQARGGGAGGRPKPRSPRPAIRAAGLEVQERLRRCSPRADRRPAADGLPRRSGDAGVATRRSTRRSTSRAAARCAVS